MAMAKISESELLQLGREAETPETSFGILGGADGQPMKESESSASTAISQSVGADTVPMPENLLAVEPKGDKTKVVFITGAAGVGKTYTIKRLIERDPGYGLLCSTTGISAINLGVVTLNSTLKYFDTASLEDKWITGRLTTMLRKIAKGYRNLIIDEVSMMHGRQLQIIHDAIAEINCNAEGEVERSFGLIVTGDYAQLPPIPEKDANGKNLPVPWAFHADCWAGFDANTVTLTKVWRQADRRFLEAINAVRAGKGGEGAEVLGSLGVRFEGNLDNDYRGTTILPKNDQVERFNQVAVMKLPSNPVRYEVRRWGVQKGEWRKNLPEVQSFKQGGYVMLLANAYDEFGGLKYANGDCGWVRGYSSESKRFTIELVRTGEDVEVGLLTRPNEQPDEPELDLRWSEGWVSDREAPHREPFETAEGRWVVGGVTYYPMRYAYAATVHKCQGLTLDKVQMDIRHGFFGAPQMCYVGLSRARSVEGLRIVGSKDTFAARVKVDEQVRRWL